MVLSRKKDCALQTVSSKTVLRRWWWRGRRWWGRRRWRHREVSENYQHCAGGRALDVVDMASACDDIRIEEVAKGGWGSRQICLIHIFMGGRERQYYNNHYVGFLRRNVVQSRPA